MLSLPNEIRTRIASEFRNAAKQMMAHQDPAIKAYFFSVFYGEPQRLANLAWSADLILIQTVLQMTTITIKGWIDAARMGELAVGVPNNFFAAWDILADDLATLFEGKDAIEEAALYKLLARAAELAYAVTGNGYYMYLKGEIPISGSTTEPEQPSSRSRSARKPKA